jgi:hypothetical protein
MKFPAQKILACFHWIKTFTSSLVKERLLIEELAAGSSALCRTGAGNKSQTILSNLIMLRRLKCLTSQEKGSPLSFYSFQSKGGIYDSL